MPRPPTTVRWLNNPEGPALLFGQLVVAANADGVAFPTVGTTTSPVTLTGPVGVISGVPAAGVAGGDAFEAVIEGEVVVRLQSGLSAVAAGQRLYVSATTDGVATNVQSPQYPVPIGSIKSLLADASLVLAAVGQVDATEQAGWDNPRFLGINAVTPTLAYSIVGPGGVISGRPAVRATAAGTAYGGVNSPPVMGVIQSNITQALDSNLVTAGPTRILMLAGLTPAQGQQLWLSINNNATTGRGRATNVKPGQDDTVHFQVPIGMIVDVTGYLIDSTVLAMYNADPTGKLIPKAPP